jgi:protein-disulfide isomerase
MCPLRPSRRPPPLRRPPRRPSFPNPIPPISPPAPTKDTVNAFLQASWGYDETRIWQVSGHPEDARRWHQQGGLPGRRQERQAEAVPAQFFALPDGKHIFAGEDIMPFGENPFAEARAMSAQQRADGPYRGSASKDLEIVEFADFQCPHCKDAQANMDKLAVDFPKARIVFQNFPLPHPSRGCHCGCLRHLRNQAGRQQCLLHLCCGRL